LKRESKEREAKFVVVFIPSKREIEKLDVSLPYQIEIAELCQRLGIEYLNLAPHFKKTWYRTYFRQGMHWNARGNKIATEALYEYLTRNTDVSPEN